MKLLLVADLHYTLRQWDWLHEAAGRFDFVVVAGDLLDLASIVPLDAQIVVVRKYLARLTAKAPLLVSSGNHDIVASDHGDERRADWLQEDRAERIMVDGDGFAHGEFFFSLLPWWDGPESLARTDAQLAAQAPLAEGKRWLWIYHSPPHGSPVAWSGREDLGDKTLLAWIDRYRPEMILGGHIHDAPFYAKGSWIDELDGTFVFNSGRQPGGVPTFTIIDTDENHATWVSAGESERAVLELPLEREALE